MNTLRTLAAAAFAVAGFATTAAQAAPEIIGSRYQESASATCTNALNCTVEFTAVPSDMGLLVTHVDCRVTVPNTAEVYGVALLTFTASAFAKGKVYLMPTMGRAITGPNDRAYTISADAQAMFAGAKPIVNFYTSTSVKSVANCTITGIRKYSTEW